MTTDPTITDADRELAERVTPRNMIMREDWIEYAAVLVARHREQREKRLDWYQDVYDFHAKFDCLINTQPTLPPENTARLRADMEREELGELHDATNDGDLAGIADAIADLIYVLLGRAVSYGIDIRPVWAAVHKANMAKVGGAKRSDGKVMKPEGWEPPDIEAIIARQALTDHGGNALKDEGYTQRITE